MSTSPSVPIESLLDREGGLFHYDDLAEAVFIQFGGPQGIARTMHDLYHDPDTSSQIKARIAIAVLDMAEWRNKGGMDKTSQDPSGLTDDELKAAIAEAMNGAAN